MGAEPVEFKKMEGYEMSTKVHYTIRGRVLLTLLATAGWPVLALCWVVYAWGQYSFFQHLVGLAIITLLYVAVTGVLWVADGGFTLVATMLATLGGVSFVLYWIGFAWTQHTLLLNGAVLLLALFAWVSAVVVLLLAGPPDPAC